MVGCRSQLVVKSMNALSYIQYIYLQTNIPISTLCQSLIKVVPLWHTFKHNLASSYPAQASAKNVIVMLCLSLYCSHSYNK